MLNQLHGKEHLATFIVLQISLFKIILAIDFTNYDII